MTLREHLIIVFGPGIICWALMSLQVLLSIACGWRPWGEPTATALYLTGAWWGVIGAVWLGFAAENCVRGWFRQ